MAAEGLDAAPHLSCIGSTRDNIREILPTIGPPASAASSPCAATSLPAWRKPVSSATPTNWWNSSGPRPATGSALKSPPTRVAPQARSPREDLQNFVRKVKAGANSAITQYFYNADAYFISGRGPLCRSGCSHRSRHHADRQLFQAGALSDACGAEIPRWMRRKFEGFETMQNLFVLLTGRRF